MVVSLIIGEPAPRRHPSLDAPRYVPRLGPRDQSLLRKWGGFVNAPAVAMPLWAALKHRNFAAEIRETFKLALAIDPEAHFAQEDEESRPSGYDPSMFGLPVGFHPHAYELTDAEADECARHTIDQANEVGATLFVTISHVCAGVRSLGRINDIRLAEAFLKYFRDEGIGERLLHDQDEIEREIFVGVTVDVETLVDPSERDLLVEAYARLRTDGYWVRILGLSDRAAPAAVAAASDFLFELQRRSALPVVLVGAGNISIAFLAAKLAAVSFGIGEHEYFASPPAKGNGKRSLVVLQPWLLRNIKVPKRGELGKGSRAFRTLPCFCDEHPSRLPPSGSEKKPHTLACRLRQAFEITQGDLDECLVRLERWIVRAESEAQRLGYPTTPFKSWREVPRAARASRARAA